METVSTIIFGGKSLNLHLSSAAQTALQSRAAPLQVEMELYFSCMIRKKVRFRGQPGAGVFNAVHGKLALAFRPVMTQRCSIHETDGPPPVTDFPINNAANFIPHWLRLDYHQGEWQGEFGY